MIHVLGKICLGPVIHTGCGALSSVCATARIIPPTWQDQAAIEDDLRRSVQTRLDLDDHRLTHECEQAFRNCDPCIWCATHFLDLTIERS